MSDDDAMRRKMREIEARAQRLNNSGGSTQVEVTRYRLWSHVLTAARAGTLAPNWRDTLTVEAVLYSDEGGRRPPAAAASTGHCDAEDLALYEVATSPVADWEPHAARGDWRRALDAWYRASLERFDAYEDAQDRNWAELRDGISPQLLRTPILGAALRKPSPLDPFMSTFHRDNLGALYRAGLAAGGETNDWIGWYRSRVAQWDTTGDQQNNAGLKQAVLASLTDPQSIIEQCNEMEKLPDYWTTAHQTCN